MEKLNKEQNTKINEMLIEGFSIKDISIELNVCREVVRRRARKLGIKPFKGKSSPFKWATAPNDLKQLIIGSLLGDGTFGRIGKHCSSCSLTIAHCMKQLEYLQFKFNILSKYELVNTIAIRKYEDYRFKNPEYSECRFKSRGNPIFTYVRNNAYINGKKIANLSIVEDIDALGLSIWYMDDGYVTKSSCAFSTCSFETSSQQRLADFLLGRFGLHFTIGHNDNSLYLLHEDFEKFKSIVSPYILPILQYKLIPYKERVLYKSDELLETCEETYGNQQPSTSLTTCEGSETNS